MKRILSLILILCALFSLVGCTGDVTTFQYYYGVIKYSDACKREVLYIPSLGDFEIPSCECVKSYFGETEEESDGYQLKVGDLVRVTFKLEGYSDAGVEILESYPARFGRAAYSIDALKEGISYEVAEGEYILSFPETEDIRSTEVGDTLYFVLRGGKDGRAFVQLYAEGEITEKQDGKVTVTLSVRESPELFLEFYNKMELRLSWEQ